MTEHEHDPTAEDRIEDLDVPESDSDDVKGGAAATQGIEKIEIAVTGKRAGQGRPQA